VVLMRHALSGLMPYGHVNEAAAELEQALESDPMSSFSALLARDHVPLGATG
jgi:hypothetical protein